MHCRRQTFTDPVVLGAGAVESVRERIVRERRRLTHVLHAPRAAGTILRQHEHVPSLLAPVHRVPVHLQV